MAAEGTPAVPAISFDNVDFRYGDGGLVLDGLNLDIHQGEMIALVGPSGAGKSTLFKLLLKFYLPRGGTLRVFGHDVGQLDTSSLRDAIAFVGQSNFIFSGSLKDNLTLKDPNVPQARVEEACEVVGLHSFIQGLPQRYDTDAGEPGTLIPARPPPLPNWARALIPAPPTLLPAHAPPALAAANAQLI